MFFEETWLDIVARAAILSIIGVAWVTALIRMIGLRTLSKMTNFDFVVTIASGSLLAGAVQASEWTAFAQALLATGGLFGVQYLIARIRRHSQAFEDAIQNGPIILMYDGKVIDKALNVSRVAESDLFAKLREANVLELNQVRAVVLETTGDISVLHGDTLEDRIIEGIERP
ncbi:MAG: DUF421 domain-containing protein [Altererythrobacter sp.]|nr:DUF421 domain-containing protein [Erythrobacter sp.]MAW90446.1 DUF421 domain-containing protein [Altererythrobacter sp.]MBK61537.1 DUF421 domain-containing protein [Altererythrobacter sp.]|tara:strand:- start:59 stop:574 length:516 start_codon:yes stop_codon:yes gene_type:complete